MVRRAFSNANLRLLPSTDPTLAKLDLLRRVDALTTSYDSSSLLSDAAGIPSFHSTTSASSLGIHGHQTRHEKSGKPIPHCRGHSLDVANSSFFLSSNAEGQCQHETNQRAFLTDDAESISGALAMTFACTTQTYHNDQKSRLTRSTTNEGKETRGHSFSAQRWQDIETIRGQRILFAARLEAELDIQRETLEADFEKSYDTLNRLHDIDLLNLKEDHDAAIEELQQERDVALSKLSALTTSHENLENDVRSLETQVTCFERALNEKSGEADRFQCRAETFWQEKNQLLFENNRMRHAIGDHDARNQDRVELHKVRKGENQIMSQLHSAEAHRDALRIQNTNIQGRYEDICAAYEAVHQEKELAKRQLAALVEEKAKDFSWHIREQKCVLALKPENPEQAEAKATALARELYHRETGKVTSLRKELTELRSTTELQLKQQVRLINDLSEEVQVNAVALETSINEKEEIAQKYQKLLRVLKSEGGISELARGLSQDLETAFAERTLFGLAFLRAELQITKGERQRRAQVCELRDRLQEKDEDLASLKERLHEVEELLSAREFVLSLRNEEIEKTVPELEDRIKELEQLMELQAMATSEYRGAVITDLKYRLDRQTQIAEFYEHHFVKTLYQMDSLKADWDFYLRGTVQDLQLARGFRDERDALQIECLAMRQRFAGELLAQPLVVPKEMKTTNQIEDEQLANMHEGVLKQFLDSYKALPKWMIEPGCPSYEVLRAEYMDAEKEKLEKEREAVERSFFVDGQNRNEASLAELLEEEEEDITSLDMKHVWRI